jgi:PKD repeat protein
MRSSRVFPFVFGLAAAVLAGCGGDSTGNSDASPTAAFTVACNQLDCTFTNGSTDDGSITTYAWEFGDGGTSSVKDPQHTFGQAGSFSVKLTVTDNAGQTGTVTNAVTVPNTPPTANFTASCTDLACTFTNTSGDSDPGSSLTAYTWNFDDPNSGSANTAATKDVNHTFSAAGTFTVALQVTDNSGATGTVSKDVTVTAAQAGGPTAAFTVTCSAADCTVTDQSTDASPGTVTGWHWDFGDGATADVKAPPAHHYTVTQAQQFTITLTVTDNDGLTSSTSKSINIAPAAGLTCNGQACTLHLDTKSTVTVTLQSHDCEVHGNTFVLTAPIQETLFTDGCYAPVAPAAGSSFQLNGGAAFNANTELAAEVRSGFSGTTTPMLQVTGNFTDGWTLKFDDGFVGPNEPDFNDLIILVKATPAP